MALILTVLFVVSSFWLTESGEILSLNFTEPMYYRLYSSHADVSSDYVPSSRSGSATSAHSCESVRSVPSSVRSRLRLGHFYKKYTEAYGIPVLGSSRVSSSALGRACYIVRFIFADRYDTRNWYYRNNGRFAIMATDEVTTHIPEHRHLGVTWNTRARGLGATLSYPVSTGAEENVLCHQNDRYRVEDIALHEFSHGLHLLGARYAIRRFDSRLKSAYDNARRRGLWANTYSMSTDKEYWAEGVQSYFNVNAYSNPPNGIHNHINTRDKLRSYDYELYKLTKEIFPCGNKYINRCSDRNQVTSSVQRLKMYPSCLLEGADMTTIKPKTVSEGASSTTVDTVSQSTTVNLVYSTEAEQSKS
ncbi:Uncharacterised protein g3216 [Pycnogonum litorale]